MSEEKMNANIRDCILNKWKGKLSYPLNYKDIEELEGIINYYEQQYEHLQKKLNKAIEMLIEYNLPCDIENFNIRNADYCSSNCSVDEEIFKKCWLKYIEQELENDNR